MNKKYSEGQKQAIVSKVLTRGNRSLSDVAEEVGVCVATIHNWIRKYAKLEGMNKPTSSSSSVDKKTPQGRLQIIKTYYSLSDLEKGHFIRSHGLFLAEIEHWVNNPVTIFDGQVVSKKEYLQEKQAHYGTQKELQRKEKALAETAALLVLQKKMQKLLGVEEESYNQSKE